jgi:hypothetical protein
MNYVALLGRDGSLPPCSLRVIYFGDALLQFRGELAEMF